MSSSNGWEPVIPKGATVLVTGANGLLGSHIVAQFLALGYNVRGAVRDPAKHADLQEFLNKNPLREAYRGKLELVAVPDITVEGAYDEAMKDVQAVVHVAAVVTFSPDPEEVIPPTVSGTINAMRSAVSCPTIKRFVLTSSSWAATFPVSGVAFKIPVGAWNETSVNAAAKEEAEGKGDMERAVHVYAASKVLSEQKAWEFVKVNREKIGFDFNTVLPSFVTGPTVDPKGSLGFPSTVGMVMGLFKGDKRTFEALPSQQYIDTRDVALLHVAAVLHPDVKSERIFGYAAQVNASLILAVLRKTYPERMFVEDFQTELDLSEVEGKGRAEELLREMGREQGFRTLEESIRDSVKDVPM